MTALSVPRYVPKEGDTITVELPDERTRAVIEQIVSDTAVLARINTFTTGNKSHDYRKNDLIPCLFQGLSMNQRGWKVVSDAEMERAEAEEIARAEAQAAPQEERVREMTEGDL